MITRQPMSVTAHSGMLSQKEQPSMAVMISSGSIVFGALPKPAAVMIVLITP